jgi:iron-sulfur cluster assembly protein
MGLPDIAVFYRSYLISPHMANQRITHSYLTDSNTVLTSILRITSMEDYMVTVTQPAKDQLDAYFAENEKAPIRIFLASGSCSGPKLSLALDEPKDTDDVFDTEGYSFVVDKDLLTQAKPLKVDFAGCGFSIDSSLELGGGGCGGGCSCSSGGCS